MYKFEFKFLTTIVLLFLSAGAYSQNSTFKNIKFQFDYVLRRQGMSVGDNDFKGIVIAIEDYLDKMKTGKLGTFDYYLTTKLPCKNGDGRIDISSYNKYKTSVEIVRKDFDLPSQQSRANPQGKEAKEYEIDISNIKAEGDSLKILNDANLSTVNGVTKLGLQYTPVSFATLSDQNSFGRCPLLALFQKASPKPIIEVAGMIFVSRSNGTSIHSTIFLAFLENKWQVVFFQV